MKYYENPDRSLLVAYDGAKAFCAVYEERQGEWVFSKRSLISLLYDDACKEISEEDALRKTDGTRPDALFLSYAELISRWLGYPEENARWGA